ncbi:DUF3601 domain-containing protein [Polaromonas aquatica]|uniref:DUF3601 domain-containing protein n=1 Tax=Polaromonas aquatica TaxID=332657 RepID=UPI003D65260D
MFGPNALGHWSGIKAPNAGGGYRFLKVGEKYRVVRPFTDHDGDLHQEGESWTFLGYAFLPYDDGLSLFVSLDGAGEWHIPMQCRPEEQGGVVDEFDDYVQSV